MPSATIIEILDEMAATLRTAVSDIGFPVQVEPRYVLSPTPPTLDIFPADPSREDTSAGMGEVAGALLFTVRARVSGDQDAEQDLLLALIDEEDDLSVAAALMDDQTLNGLASSVYVQGPSGYRHYVDAGSEGAYLGCEWHVTVLRAHS